MKLIAESEALRSWAGRCHSPELGSGDSGLAFPHEEARTREDTGAELFPPFKLSVSVYPSSECRQMLNSEG